MRQAGGPCHAACWVSVGQAQTRGEGVATKAMKNLKRRAKTISTQVCTQVHFGQHVFTCTSQSDRAWLGC